MFDCRPFDNRTFECVRLTKCFCEFDYVRLPNTIERLVFDFVRLPNVRLEAPGRFHRALVLFVGRHVLICSREKAALYPYNLCLTFLRKISDRQFFFPRSEKISRKACLLHASISKLSARERFCVRLCVWRWFNVVLFSVEKLHCSIIICV